MTAWFVSRHAGAERWAREEGLTVDRWVAHIDTAQVMAGDVVIGSLPVNLAAEVCARGARYLHLVLPLTPTLRGVEMTAAHMRECGARVEAFIVRRDDRPVPGRDPTP